MKFTFPVIGLSLLSASMHLSAEEFEDHGAHVHGVAELQIVAEQNTLMLHLDSPAMNLVGFEHEVKNHEQAEKLEKALSVLSKTDELFLLEGGGCNFIDIDVDSPFTEAGHHGKHEGDHDHEHEDHHDKHENEHDHDEHHDKHEHDHGEHREFEAEYKANCRDISKLTRIELPLLNAFEGIEKLDVQYVIEGRQGAVELTQANASLDLSK